MRKLTLIFSLLAFSTSASADRFAAFESSLRFLLRGIGDHPSLSVRLGRYRQDLSQFSEAHPALNLGEGSLVELGQILRRRRPNER
jgi:hypothetical protein